MAATRSGFTIGGRGGRGRAAARRLGLSLALLASPAAATPPPAKAGPAHERRVAASPAPLPPPLDTLPPAATHTYFAAVGGGPRRVFASLALERGLYSIVALHAETRLHLDTGGQGAPRPGIALLVGPTLVVDVLALVPRLFLLAGVQAGGAPSSGGASVATPALAWGCQLDRFLTARLSVGVRLQASFTGQAGVRGDASLSVGYTP